MRCVWACLVIDKKDGDFKICPSLRVQIGLGVQNVFELAPVVDSMRMLKIMGDFILVAAM